MRKHSYLEKWTGERPSLSDKLLLVVFVLNTLFGAVMIWWVLCEETSFTTPIKCLVLGN